MSLITRFTRIGSNLLVYSLLIGVSTLMILPFLWMLDTSLKPAAETFAHPPIIISSNFNLQAYIMLIRDFHFLRILFNTVLIALSATLLQLLFCSLGGYGFAKYKFPGQRMLFSLLLGTMIVPFVNLMVPLYLIMRDLHWIDTYWPLIIPWAANAFGIFFMRQYISTISDELLDAARIDGASEFVIYWRVILPIISPGLTSLGLIIFMGTWNGYLWPLVILKSPEKFTLPLLINSMGGTVGRTAWELTMAASLLSVLPLLILFFIFQRRYFEGITAGAVRG
ncbi:MAG TPA: carbohydrate ABC transporter permease [Anaerolineales bacterium]|nr:carbohydrate ABC transporter permease [Anaerolineales bacterium]